MGAAVGKAAFDLASPPETRAAAARLALAENTMLQWTRSAADDTGIWDADANYTNTALLAAVDEVLLLAEEDPFPPSARCRLDGAVAVAVSRLVEEFLRVRVWNAAQLRFAVDRLSLASSGASAILSAGDRTSTASTGGEVDASDGTQSRASSSSVPYEVVALVDGEFLDALDLIRPAGVSVLHEIARRVVRADGTKELLRSLAKAKCDVLDSFLSILRVECSPRTTEVVIKRWSAVTKVVERAVLAMRRQLYAQNNSGAFDSFRDEYLLAIAESRVLVLLQFADEFTRVTSHEKLLYILGMYEALSEAAPGLLLLFTGPRKELVSARMQEILAKLADVANAMVSELIAKVRSSDPPPSSQMPSSDDGVHPLARYAMARVETLAPHRTVLGLILASSDVDDGSAARVTTFAGLVAELIDGLERNLEEKSELICADVAGGSASAHLFLANNMSFVLRRAADADVASLLGDEWAARRRSQMERHAASYAEAAWGPVAACLDGGGNKPARALEKFNAALETTHGAQVCRAVPDPALRGALRHAVSEKVVTAYLAFLRKHPKLRKSARYSADDLAEKLSELFEGEAAEVAENLSALYRYIFRSC